MIQKMYSRWREDIRGVVQEGVEGGAFGASAAQGVPVLMVSLMEGAALQYLIDGDALDLDSYFDGAMALISRLSVAAEE